jgi:hypothetical protein
MMELDRIHDMNWLAGVPRATLIGKLESELRDSSFCSLGEGLTRLTHNSPSS